MYDYLNDRTHFFIVWTVFCLSPFLIAGCIAAYRKLRDMWYARQARLETSRNPDSVLILALLYGRKKTARQASDRLEALVSQMQLEGVLEHGAIEWGGREELPKDPIEVGNTVL